MSSIEFLASSILVEINLNDNNQLKHNSTFEFLSRRNQLEILEMRNVSLKQADDLFLNSKLTKLDLSLNSLVYIKRSSFQNLTNLKYLDLSCNKITNIEAGTLNSTKMLEYLNIQANQVKFISDDSFRDYKELTYLYLSANSFAKIPSLDITFIMEKTSQLKEIFLDKNCLSSFQKNLLPYSKKLQKIILDFNEIHFIEKDAFLNLKELLNLSISNNFLKNISKNDFFTLFSLKYLNLSSNLIEYIETDSFINLNKLSMLDLSMNSLKAISSGIFNGLTQLKDLHLISKTILEFSKESFDGLSNTSLSNIYLNESMIEPKKCLLIKVFDRNSNSHIEKILKISNDFKFYYKSINIITEEFNVVGKSELVFHFLQFNIHYNAKSDMQIENFYTDLSKRTFKSSANYYNLNRKKCSNETLSETSGGHIFLTYNLLTCILMTVDFLSIYFGLFY